MTGKGYQKILNFSKDTQSQSKTDTRCWPKTVLGKSMTNLSRQTGKQRKNVSLKGPEPRKHRSSGDRVKEARQEAQAIQKLYTAYRLVEEEELVRQLLKIETANGDQKYGEVWRTVN